MRGALLFRRRSDPVLVVGDPRFGLRPRVPSIGELGVFPVKCGSDNDRLSMEQQVVVSFWADFGLRNVDSVVMVAATSCRLGGDGNIGF